jgi:hypothetical protein
MRYCGNCGTALTLAALQTGHCQKCGTNINDTVSAAEASAMAEPHPQQPFPPGPYPSARGGAVGDSDFTYPDYFFGPPPAKPPPTKRNNGRWRWFLLVPLILLVVTAGLIIIRRPGASSSIAKTTPAATATASSGTTPTATLAASPTVTNTTTGAATATTPLSGQNQPTSTPPPPPPGGGGGGGGGGGKPPPPPDPPPNMVISQIIFSQLACVESAITFTVTNSGGHLLNYSITSSSLLPYTFDRLSGSLDHGESDTVHVTMINSGGTITVSAYGVNSQNITISCL